MAKAVASRPKRTATKAVPKTAPKTAPKPPAKKPTESNTSRKRKAAHDEEDLNDAPRPTKPRATHIRKATARPAKKTKTAPGALPTLNKPPTQVLTVFAFGTGDCGELGLGPSKSEALRPFLNRYLDPSNPEGFLVVALANGGMHSVAITAGNQIVTWGVNDKGALGRDTEWEGGKWKDADGEEQAEDEEPDMNPLESTPTALPEDAFPEDTVFVQVGAGDSCSFALTDTGLVYGWGTFLNSEGKPGFCYGPDGQFIEVQKRPMLLPGLKDITQIANGANHALALDARGNIWAWGVGEQAQLGRRLMTRRGEHQGFAPARVEIARGNATHVASGSYHSFAVDGRGNVWAWGLNGYGEAGNYAGGAATLPHPMKIAGLAGKGVVMVDGGAHHSVAVTGEGACFVWGRIDGGQLGWDFSAEQLADEGLVVRDERDRPRICTRPVAVPHIGEAVWASCGTEHTIFVTRDGRALSTGFGTMGQLGLGGDGDVHVAQVIDGKAVRKRVLTWSGCGGQYSMVAGP